MNCRNEFLREEDLEMFERELDSFVPDKVYDAHCHLLVPGDPQPLWDACPEGVGHAECMQWLDCLLPGRDIAANFLSFAVDPDWAAKANEWGWKAAACDPRCRAEFFVKPNDDPDWIRQEVQRLGSSGLKCYHLQAVLNPSWRGKTWEAEIPDFLPEAFVQVAHELGLVITLHMVKTRAVADPSNIHWIRHYCESYPDMKLILAHSARGFQPQHNLEGLVQLQDLNNLYFDCSANCEPVAHQSIFRVFGHEKMMYGSDFPVSHKRGKHFGVADSFLWLYEDTPVWGEKHLQVKPVLVGLENLRSFKWACWSERLSDSQVEDLFWNNAAKLFGV